MCPECEKNTEDAKKTGKAAEVWKNIWKEQGDNEKREKEYTREWRGIWRQIVGGRERCRDDVVLSTLHTRENLVEDEE